MASQAQATAFAQQLGPEGIAFWNEVANKPFSDQAMYFLNAYWPEVGGQAEFIFHVSWEKMKYADMHAKGVSLVFKYDEGNELELNIGLYFYEKMCAFLEDDKNKQWADDKWKISHPQMMTALTRKQEIREKVDVNFDNKISFLEVLLYQYREFANPADFVHRAMSRGEEHPEIRKARLALAEVSERIKKFEQKKSELEAIANGGNSVKALGAKNELAQLHSDPLGEALATALIKAEAAVRIATKKFGSGAVPVKSDGTESRNTGGDMGTVTWMNLDLEEKKKRYGPMKKD